MTAERIDSYQAITDRVIALLEAGTVPWRRPWSTPGADGHPVFPTNGLTHKPYRGVNVLVLACAGYPSPYWVTFKQALTLGGRVRKGEHGTPLVFFHLVGDCRRCGRDADVHPSPACARFDGPATLRRFTVFNVAQCDAMPDDLTTPPAPPPVPTFDPLDACEDVIAGYQARGGPRIEEVPALATPLYDVANDYVALPPAGTFESPAAFYAAVFHELGHSTRHASRLDRTLVYATEELIAELTAAYLCGATGILPPVVANTAAYLQSWLDALRADKRLIVVAAAQAQKAADWILGTRAAAAAEAVTS